MPSFVLIRGQGAKRGEGGLNMGDVGNARQIFKIIWIYIVLPQNASLNRVEAVIVITTVVNMNRIVTVSWHWPKCCMSGV